MPSVELAVPLKLCLLLNANANMLKTLTYPSVLKFGIHPVTLNIKFQVDVANI